MTDFDPYYKWLAIPPNEQPPNHYRLLGVPLFTLDADVIDNAADQRMTHLRSYQSGKYSAESQRLLNEVSQARACLLVPERRAEYDAALKKKLQPTPPQPAQQAVQQPGQLMQQPLPQAVARPASPQFVAPAQPQYVPQPQYAPAQPQYPTARQLPLPSRTPIPVQQPVPQPAPAPPAPNISVSSNRPRKAAAGGVEMTKHIAASLVGLLLGYFIICWILPSYDFLGLFHARPKDQPDVTENTQQPVPIKPKPIDPAPIPPQPIPQPPVVRPAETKKIETKPAETKINETKKTETKEPEPIPAPPTLSDAEQQQARIDKLKADRATALEKNELSRVLLMTDELAKLEATDALSERARMINELRKTERSPAEVTLLATQLIDLATAAAKADRHDFAAEQATAALLLARKSGDQELVRKATKLVLEVQEKKPSP